jgi:heme oxygenase
LGVGQGMDQAADSGAILPAGGALLVALREGTRDEHERLERQSWLRSVDLGIEQYRRGLAAFLGIHRPLEPAIAGALAAEALIMPWTPRASLLERDLGDLGMTPDLLAGVPDCPTLPLISDVGSALGCLYVLEGSTLGGQVLARELGRRLGVGPGRGGAYFRGYGAETRSHWRAFTEALGRASECADLSLRTAVSAAVATFQAFATWTPTLGPETGRSS